MSQLPSHASISIYGIEYRVDLEACRVRMLERVAELAGASDGLRDQAIDFRRKGGMQRIAAAAGVDRATLRRFFRGEQLTVETFTAIVTRGLRLDMQTVVRKAA